MSADKFDVSQSEWLNKELGKIPHLAGCNRLGTSLQHNVICGAIEPVSSTRAIAVSRVINISDGAAHTEFAPGCAGFPSRVTPRQPCNPRTTASKGAPRAQSMFRLNGRYSVLEGR